jgi:nitroimidazol reductase NimA-like FMN-containing flavoprotein (pyridoxamine 5'-phosphate oxidase superfamily)
MSDVGGSAVWKQGASNCMSDSMTQEPGNIQDTIRRVLERNRLAVLATQLNGQPHASIIAFTPLEGLQFLAFATYRDTLKYKSIREDRRVAILIEDREGDARGSDRRLVLTAVGEAIETREEDRHAHIVKHLEQHPDLEKFLSSPDCEFVRVAVHAYQVVSDIDDVRWYAIGESALT